MPGSLYTLSVRACHRDCHGTRTDVANHAEVLEFCANSRTGIAPEKTELLIPYEETNAKPKLLCEWVGSGGGFKR